MEPVCDEKRPPVLSSNQQFQAAPMVCYYPGQSFSSQTGVIPQAQPVLIVPGQLPSPQGVSLAMKGTSFSSIYLPFPPRFVGRCIL